MNEREGRGGKGRREKEKKGTRRRIGGKERAMNEEKGGG